jgi:hypothetical protein
MNAFNGPAWLEWWANPSTLFGPYDRSDDPRAFTLTEQHAAARSANG